MSNVIKDRAEAVGAIAGAAIAVIVLYGLLATSYKEAKKAKETKPKIYVIK